MQRPFQPSELELFHLFLGEFLETRDLDVSLEQAITIFRQQPAEARRQQINKAAIRWAIDEEYRGNGTPFSDALNRVSRSQVDG